MVRGCAELLQIVFFAQSGDGVSVTYGGTMPPRSGLNRPYEVVPGPAAIRTILSMARQDREGLAEALRTELLDGPNAGKEFRFDSDVRACRPGVKPNGQVYTATPLSFAGCTAIHRRLTSDEITRLRKEESRSVAKRGVYVIDILPAESAFGRPGPRPA